MNKMNNVSDNIYFKIRNQIKSGTDYYIRNQIWEENKSIGNKLFYDIYFEMQMGIYDQIKNKIDEKVSNLCKEYLDE